MESILDRKPLSLDVLVSRIQVCNQFSLSRWGDGEFHAIFETGLKRNCDGSRITREIGVELKKVLLAKHNYYYCLLDCAIGMFDNKICTLIGDNGRIEWNEGDFFVEASTNGDLFPFIEAVRQRRTAYIGPPHLIEVSNDLGCPFFLQIPRVDAFYFIQDIIINAINLRLNSRVDLFLVSAGFAAKIIVDRLWEHIGKEVTIIDVGSLFDPYAGVQSRSYNIKYDWNNLRKKNFEGL